MKKAAGAKHRIWPWILMGILLVIVLVAVIYVQDYYRALPEAQAVAETMRSDDGNLTFDGDTGHGIVLYPGGKVDARAYAPLAQMLHDASGDTVVIARMPLRLAILDTDRAMDILAAHPGIDAWTIVGHSLGGTAASMVVAKHPDAFDGIVLLGSYASGDLRDFAGDILLLTGTEDGVLNREKAAEAEALLAPQAVHAAIEGGNHAGFGTYGPQDGDGMARISAAEQQAIVVQEMLMR